MLIMRLIQLTNNTIIKCTKNNYTIAYANDEW